LTSRRRHRRNAMPAALRLTPWKLVDVNCFDVPRPAIIAVSRKTSIP